MQIEIRALEPADIPVCAEILRSLPEWFGLEESNREYIDSLQRFPAFVATANDRIVGFLSAQEHNTATAEISVMAVERDLHRSGIGRRLIEHVEQWARNRDFQLLHVKTRGPSGPDPFYARTQKFYEALGFLPLFETAALWGEEDPALLLVKPLLR